ncbi:MAG: class I SAM-dependent methyltransferase [Acidimicrobiales bacterium]
MATNPAWVGPRDEVVALVPDRAKRILDVGASNGTVGEALRQVGKHVTGIEILPELAAQAEGRLDEVIVADVEDLALRGVSPGGPFDCVVMADVLEHLRDPWAVVKWATTLLPPDGSLVISVPNVAHIRTVWNLLGRKRWVYEEFGIFDRTHLRWFGRANLDGLLTGTGLRIVDLQRKKWLGNPGSPLSRLAPYLGDLSTYQFVFRAERA